jgi:cyanophycinase-like exopeptidase
MPPPITHTSNRSIVERYRNSESPPQAARWEAFDLEYALRMPGPLALLGSGEFLPVMEDLDRSLLDGRPQRVVHLPTAAGQEGPSRVAYWRDLAATHFTRLGAEIITLDVLDRTGAERPELVDEIRGTGMIFLSGGDPHHLTESLRHTPMWGAIVSEWETGAALVGCSAGAMAIAEVIPAFRREAGEALGLLENLSVIPHYDRFGKLMKPVVRIHDRHVTLVGIDEDTAIHGGPDEWTVYGRGSVHIANPDRHETFAAGDRLTLP